VDDEGSGEVVKQRDTGRQTQ